VLKKILILESKEAILEIMKEVMLSEGYMAKGVIFPYDFIQTIACYKPDLIVMEYKLLFDFDGEELCRQIKINPQTAHIPLIMISVYPRVLNPLNEYGPDAFICKPFSLEQLTTWVKDLLFLEK
jgi:DNA-binding response OmpR family regulator